MLGLPASTEFNKRVPKTKFYANLGMTPAVKRLFAEQIESVYWRNKISPDTVNIAGAENVKEIEFFEIRLNQKKIDKRILEIIDREIPYHIVFVLSFENEEQLAIGYKQESGNREDKYMVDTYYYSEWVPQAQLKLELKALNLDSLYENWLKSLMPAQAAKAGHIADVVSRQKEIERLEKQVTALERKIGQEKQFNIKVKLNQELRELKSSLCSLK